MDIFILGLLIFLNALFSMSEIALVSARKSRLEDLADKGDKKAKLALELASHPEFFLSAVQIGITLISIVTGVYTGERFGKNLQPFFENIKWLRPYAEVISTAIIVIIVTFLSMIFGELIPKQFGLLKSEKIARTVAVPMRAFARLFHPFVWLLTKASQLFFRALRIRTVKENIVTEEEIKTLITEGAESGTIEEAEQEIIERVFHLSDRNITSLMTHRSDIIWISPQDTEKEIKEKILREPHSTYPVCDGDIDNIKGVIYIKDLYVAGSPIKLNDIMKPALFVPENNSAYQVLEKFKESKNHSAFIVDEYGSVLGLITLNDILEAIVGDMPQPDIQDYEIIKREDGSFLIDAQISFYDFLNHFDKTDWIKQEEQNFDTLAGFILHKLERIPREGDFIHWRGFRLEVVDMDGHRIDKLLVTLSEELKTEMESNNL
ncbi:MAG: hemolysin family protein [Chitinophagaceae bacterium]|nr:hemolysin family protein [Chitinophagaceae bacterium]